MEHYEAEFEILYEDRSGRMPIALIKYNNGNFNLAYYNGYWKDCLPFWDLYPATWSALRYLFTEEDLNYSRENLDKWMKVLKDNGCKYFLSDNTDLDTELKYMHDHWNKNDGMMSLYDNYNVFAGQITKS